MRKFFVLSVCAVCFCATLNSQSQSYYSGSIVTGQLQLVRVVDPLVVTQLAPMAASRSMAVSATPSARPTPEFRDPGQLKRPGFPKRPFGGAFESKIRAFGFPPVTALTYTLPVAGLPPPFSFNGISHYDQRMAHGGNQYSVEPPNTSIAVGGGFILEGVNNAVQVYSTSGAALLPRVLSSNEWFGVPAAINRNTGENGPFPTDMRVFYDHGIERWFVLQRAQDYDVSGYPMNSSRLYLAVSQTADPTRAYNIYEMNTTNLANPGCPCLLDFPQIGADQYGFYVSGNEYNTFSETFVNAAILAISKSSLASGAAAPTAYRFSLPYSNGHEFAIQPASTAPGSSNFLANGGLVYFLSNNAYYAYDNQYSIWAMYNTSSLGTANPNLFLTRTTVPGPHYSFPPSATQRPGPVPYGASQVPPRGVALIDGGDARILSLTYAGGRLYATYCTQVTDSQGANLVGGGYVAFAPSFRAGLLTAPVLTSGYLAARGNHLLRPSIAVNAKGKGAIAFTIVGPDYYPSAAFVPFDLATPPSALRVVTLGSAPQDGFTGYEGYPARWGDYNAAVSLLDGSIWLATQYIPSTPRTEAANWGTRVIRYVP